MVADSATPWLLLLHQIPARPAYLRVKVWRRLQALGALPLKNAAYLLPNTDQAREDFAWVLRELVQAGGGGSLCEARVVEGWSDAEIQDSFRRARDQDYAGLAEEARKLARALASRKKEQRTRGGATLERLRNRLEEIIRIDFFGAAGREPAEGLLRGLESLLAPASGADGVRRTGAWRKEDVQGRAWVTRKGVHIDRIASAWLIRRFIDPQARFRFVAGRNAPAAPGALRFDMYEGEFTHDGELCTFEVLVREFGLGDPALRPIAEIVHDIDLKEARSHRPETAGIEHLVAGIAWAHDTDEARLDAGCTVFEGLHAYFSRRKD